MYGYRLRLILCEENPTILGMEQNLWVAGQRHNERGAESLGLVLRMMAGHDLSHVEQCHRYIEAAESGIVA